jgi:hypothetical protein
MARGKAVRKLFKPIAVGIACWEIAAFSGYPSYAAFAGAAGFFGFWLISLILRKLRPHFAAALHTDVTQVSPVDPEPVDVAVSDQTAIW